MGSLFTSDSASQSTTSQQVGVQGGSGGTTVGFGANDSGNIINVESPDVDAVHAVNDIASKSLEAGAYETGQAIQGVTTIASQAESLAGYAIGAEAGTAHDSEIITGAIAAQSINSAQQVAINALEDIHAQQVTDSGTTHDAVQAAVGIAGQAAPQSAGFTAESLSTTNSKTVEYVAIAAAISVGLYFLAKRA